MKNKIYLFLAVILAVSTVHAVPTSEASIETADPCSTFDIPAGATAEATILENAMMSGGCEVDPGSLTAVQTPVCLDPIEGTAILEATENNAPTVPDGYQSLYLLSQGSEFLIVDVDTIPSFTINEAATYTIHTLVYSPGTYDPDDISFGITTAEDIAENFLQGGGKTCGVIDAVGTQFEAEDCPCEADAGTLSPIETPVCLGEDGMAEIAASEETTTFIPDDFEVLYVLTLDTTLLIMDTNTAPAFTVDAIGNFAIHTLVYDPNILDLSMIEIGETSGFDVNDMLIQGGGDICAALDVDGAEIEVCEYTGINERLSQHLDVFPNPSNGQFVVELEGGVGQGSVRIFDISGRRVFHRDVFFNGQFRLDVELNVAPGTYTLQILTAEGSATRTLEVM